MIHLRELDQFTKKFATCAYGPLCITVHLQPNSRIVNYDPIHLDGLLARAVVARATQGHLLADSEDGYWIPLPLKMLWQSEEGYPLWAASVFYPISDTVDDIYVRHKRNAGGWMHNKKKLTTRNGPWMERRLPTPVQVCDRYEARCIGNLDVVQNLLGYFTHIGKLRLGRVKNVNVELYDYADADVLYEAGKLLRPLPAISLDHFDNLLPIGASFPIGWTPPFWKPSLFRPGWRTGMQVHNIADEIDYFGTTDQL